MTQTAGQTQNVQYKMGAQDALMQECIKNCLECAKTCNTTLNHCLSLGNGHASIAAIKRTYLKVFSTSQQNRGEYIYR